MKKICMVIMLLSITTSALALSSTEKEILVMFTDTEKCIILAFKNQLNSKVLNEIARLMGKTTSLNLEDIAQICHGMKFKSVENFLGWIEIELSKKNINVDHFLQFNKFRQKVLWDYFYYKHKQKEGL